MKRTRSKNIAVVGIVAIALFFLMQSRGNVLTTAVRDARANPVQALLDSRNRDELLFVRGRPEGADAGFPLRLPEAGLSGAEADRAVFDDLVVDEGETINDGVVVYAGDARVKNDGRITGDLVVYNGDIRVDEGGRVDGDVSTFSGDIRVDGSVGGNLTTLSGDVTLRDSANVGGDISVLNGDVNRSSGATVGGNVVRGPSIELPPIPAAPFSFGQQAVAGADNLRDATPGIFARVGRFILRIIGMLLLSLVVGFVVWLIAQIRPSTIHSTQARMTDQAALSFVVGLLANVVLLLLGAFFAITICLMPLTLLTYLFIIGLNIIGWAAIASVVSQWVTERYELAIRWDYAVAITAALLASVFGLLWAMGWCFRFFGFAGILIISSIGVGAVLLPLLNKHMGVGTSHQLPESSSASAESEDARGASVVVPDITDEDTYAIVDEDFVPAEDKQDEQIDEDDVELPDVDEPDVDETGVDFTKLRGIGPVAADRLTAAGVKSFSELSQMSAEEIGQILRWSADRVRQTDIIGQATELAASGN